jgi:alkylated DNA repair dioxygenase AlkB
MATLFPVSPAYPPGFTYIPGFITETDEADLCNEISKIELHTFTFQGFEAKRKVASFGYDYSFEKAKLSKGKDIPPSFNRIIKLVADQISVNSEAFAELLVTQYPVGSVINWHRDAPPFDIIAGISLKSDCTFRLRPYKEEKRTRKTVISFPVKRRSLYVIRGESRTDWQHSIAPVKAERYSITLRTLYSGTL